MKIDSLNKRILSELMIDSRIPESTLAKRLGTSRDVIRYRISQLEEHDFIKGYSTLES